MSHLLAIGSIGNMEFLVIAVLALIGLGPPLIGMGFLVWHLAKEHSQNAALPQSPPPLPKQPPGE